MTYRKYIFIIWKLNRHPRYSWSQGWTKNSQSVDRNAARGLTHQPSHPPLPTRWSRMVRQSSASLREAGASGTGSGMTTHTHTHTHTQPNHTRNTARHPKARHTEKLLHNSRNRTYTDTVDEASETTKVKPCKTWLNSIQINTAWLNREKKQILYEEEQPTK